MYDSGKFGVGRAASAAAKARLSLDDLHLQSRAGADYGHCEPVGAATDDGDVHPPITADSADGGIPYYAGRVNLPVVLIADKLAQSTVAALGDQVEVRWVDGPDREKLLAAVPEADALLVRSATTVDAEVLAAAPKLKIVARAGVGLDNVDVDAATARGVLVVNAPTSNIHSAAEHAIALLLAASRQIAAADASLRERAWKRSSFSGTEIFGKTVGVVGLGRIGQLVAQRIAAFGAHIVAYDPYVSPARAAQLGIELMSLDELLTQADFISVHLPKTPETAGLIDKEALAKTKPGVIIVNAARGGLVDEAALADAIISGHVRAAGLDVFATEPCTDSPLFELPQVVVTPHLGASTAEAQDRAGTDVAESVRLALAGEFVPDAVNVGGGVVNEEVAPWLDLARKLGVLVAALSDELPVSLSVQVRGELAAEEVEVLKLSALRGLFSAVIEDPVTFVNAPALAAERGVTADITKATESPNHRSMVDVRGVAADGSVVNVAGTLSGPQLTEKIVQINGRNFDLRAQGTNLVINYIDQPGALGKIGTLLGMAGVNIQAAQLSEDAEGPGATILLRLDQDVPDDVRSAISEAVGANRLEVVDLS
ncbi:phosphoglycerate dehydrogenase [Mycobacterium riyadhense]